MRKMADWSELQHDLLVVIARRINLIEDYLSFGTVCKSWHSVATKGNFNSNLPRVPWLMLAEDDDDDGDNCRKFFSLYNGMILKKRIPGAIGKRCMESMGWLITVGKDEGEMSLLHPFSGVEIPLPHQRTTERYETNRTPVPWTFIRRAVLSANPSDTSDYVLMVVEGRFEHLSLWRPGDLLWTRVRVPARYRQISDLVYFSGHFFAVTFGSCVQVYDVVVSELDESRLIIEELAPWSGGRNYILESQGSLFVVAQKIVDIRYVKDELERNLLLHIPVEDYNEETISTYRTRNFLVFQVDLANCQATPTRDLGDQAFFLGANASLSVQASQFPGIKPNHIYFTDNWLGSYVYFERGGGMDMGVFNLADGSFQPHYDGVSVSRFCPPIWVTPNPC